MKTWESWMNARGFASVPHGPCCYVVLQYLLSNKTRAIGDRSCIYVTPVTNSLIFPSSSRTVKAMAPPSHDMLRSIYPDPAKSGGVAQFDDSPEIQRARLVG